MTAAPGLVFNHLRNAQEIVWLGDGWASEGQGVHKDRPGGRPRSSRETPRGGISKKRFTVQVKLNVLGALFLWEFPERKVSASQH